MCKGLCVNAFVWPKVSSSSSSSSSKEGGGIKADGVKKRGKRTKEQVRVKNRHKYKTRTDTRALPCSETRRQACGGT